MRGEMAVLRLLAVEKQPLLAGEISKKLSMTTSRNAAVHNSLEKKKMIERCEDAEDRRRVLVRLTQEGMAFCKGRHAEARTRFAHLLERLGNEDARQFVNLLKRVFAILESECEGRKNHEGGIS